MVQKPESDTEPRERRIDLSLPQVAGSAVAAVAAAVAASQLGVYGTILGAGVMSIVATCGGSVFQHFFRRTGEQIREVTVQAKFTGRETRGTREMRDAYGAPDPQEVRAARDVAERETWAGQRSPDGSADATAVLRTVAADPDRTQLLKPLADHETQLLKPLGTDRTQLLTSLGTDRTQLFESRAGDGARRAAPHGAAPDEEFSASTTHGTRIRGWKRSAVGAAAVFAVSMAGITTYELVSGGDLSGGQGTTVGSVVRGGERGSGPAEPAPPVSTGPEQGRTPGQESGGTPGADSQGGQSPSPGTGQGDRSTAEPTPTPTPSNSGGGPTAPAPTPTPAASGDSSSVAPDPTGAGIAPGQQAPATTGTGTGR
ncbi:hypothetical protein [Streptomyces sp. NBC_01320]|uniref:hypothetical protein n=1 Tax=Streptomyces sp. NBC_01320 TaxID=2903824 RepID=UPI002E0D68C7|nr:hypothetical protein OG395_18500 [Streptomyces sp. NBC_01320]